MYMTRGAYHGDRESLYVNSFYIVIVVICCRCLSFLYLAFLYTGVS